MDNSYVFNLVSNIIHSEISLIDNAGNTIEKYSHSSLESDSFYSDINSLQNFCERKNIPMPDIICHDTCIYYAKINLQNGNYILLGPVRVIKDKFDTVQRSKNNNIPFCKLKIFLSGVLLLHHYVTGRKIRINELYKFYGITEKENELNQKELSSLIFKTQETEIPHNPYNHEVRKLDSIKAGNVEKLKECQHAAWAGEIGRVAENPLRQEKNIAIIVIVLASRAGIQGGLSPELAFSMADTFILHIEKMSDILHIQAATFQYEIEFAQSVYNLSRANSKNRYAEQAKEYIFKHLHKNIPVSEISTYLGINKDYLSALFRKSEGITIQHYIKKEKIRQAELMLKYSNYKINEVSNILSFSSQSHFSYCFKEETGMTPAQYRNQYANN